MFLAFISNINLQTKKALYLDTFYKMLKFTNKEDVHYVLTDEYLQRYDNVWANNLINYNDINFNELNKTIISNYTQSYLNFPINQQLKMFNQEFNKELFNELKKIDCRKIEYIVSWINNKTLDVFATYLDVPIIYNELGALRPNLWKDSIYLDFNGVNGKTSFDRRLKKFMEVCKDLPLLSHEELISLVAQDRIIALNIYHNYLHRTDCDKVGVALQVPQDSNLLMYSNGWSTVDIINYAYNKYGKENILIKNHPHSSLQHKDNNFKYASSAEELLMRSKKILTINSSMGFEALLLGKEADFLGENPFKQISSMYGEDRLKALNFAILNYLVPEYLLFNKEYYEYRIECFDEKELFYNGLENWKNYKGRY